MNNTEFSKNHIKVDLTPQEAVLHLKDGGTIYAIDGNFIYHLEIYIHDTRCAAVIGYEKVNVALDKGNITYPYPHLFGIKDIENNKYSRLYKIVENTTAGSGLTTEEKNTLRFTNLGNAQVALNKLQFPDTSCLFSAPIDLLLSPGKPAEISFGENYVEVSEAVDFLKKIIKVLEE